MSNEPSEEGYPISCLDSKIPSCAKKIAINAYTIHFHYVRYSTCKTNQWERGGFSNVMGLTQPPTLIGFQSIRLIHCIFILPIPRPSSHFMPHSLSPVSLELSSHPPTLSHFPPVIELFFQTSVRNLSQTGPSWLEGPLTSSH